MLCSGLAVATPACLICLDSYRVRRGRIRSWAGELLRSQEEEKEVCIKNKKKPKKQTL